MPAESDSTIECGNPNTCRKSLRRIYRDSSRPPRRNSLLMFCTSICNKQDICFVQSFSAVRALSLDIPTRFVARRSMQARSKVEKRMHKKHMNIVCQQHAQKSTTSRGSHNTHALSQTQYAQYIPRWNRLLINVQSCDGDNTLLSCWSALTLQHMCTIQRMLTSTRKVSPIIVGIEAEQCYLSSLQTKPTLEALPSQVVLGAAYRGLFSYQHDIQVGP